MSPFAKAAMQFQAFLLRRNWIGPMSDFVMVITTIGRKSGKQFSTPIGYVRDGDDLIGLSVEGRANWYKNLLQNPNVTLSVKGRDVQAKAEPVRDGSERQRIFELYKRTTGENFPRIFALPPDAPEAVLAEALAKREFVRFRILK